MTSKDRPSIATWRRLLQRLAKRNDADPTLPFAVEGPIQPGPGSDLLHRLLTEDSELTHIDNCPETILTDLLYSRIPESSLKRFEDWLTRDPELKQRFAQFTPLDRRKYVIRYGTWFLPGDFNPHTGLSRFEPPESVHAMDRSTIHCGSFYYGDLLAWCLKTLALNFEPGGRYLDFGCSSGRVLKTLTAAFPEALFHGCDPVADTILWAQKDNPLARFMVSNESPPLPYDTASFDGIFAISIFSHFEQAAFRIWLDEMKRIIKPGGFLIFSTHGFGAIRFYFENRLMEENDALARTQALIIKGHAFDRAYAKGFWSLESESWGQAYYAPNFLVHNFLDGWRLRLYRSRIVERNQDLFVFESVAHE